MFCCFIACYRNVQGENSWRCLTDLTVTVASPVRHPSPKRPRAQAVLVSSSSNLLAKELSRGGGVMEASMLLARPHLSFPCGASSRSIASTSAKQVDLETWVWDLRFAFFFRSDLTAFSCHCNLSSEFLTGEAAIFY